ncbi:MAG: ABC transporter ATP-binding protein [Thermogutta sp.]
MIVFSEVTKRFGQKIAVERLNLTIPPGELFAFLGPNGAGKTTTIRMLVGLLRPNEGELTVCGFNATTQCREAARFVGYVPDQPYLYDKLTGREFLEFVGKLRGISSSELAVRIEREIERFGMTEFVDDLAETYSHGMRQRLVFASALLHDPKVLIVDEPMVGLDPKSAKLVKDLLKAKTSEGTSVFMSTHTLSIAEEIADRIGIIHKGKLIFAGTVNELRALRASDHASLEEIFLELTDEFSTELTDTRLAIAMGSNPDNEKVSDNRHRSPATNDDIHDHQSVKVAKSLSEMRPSA